MNRTPIYKRRKSAIARGLYREGPQLCGTISGNQYMGVLARNVERSCEYCGYHVCSCDGEQEADWLGFVKRARRWFDDQDHVGRGSLDLAASHHGLTCSVREPTIGDFRWYIEDESGDGCVAVSGPGVGPFTIHASYLEGLLAACEARGEGPKGKLGRAAANRAVNLWLDAHESKPEWTPEAVAAVNGIRHVDVDALHGDAPEALNEFRENAGAMILDELRSIVRTVADASVRTGETWFIPGDGASPVPVRHEDARAAWAEIERYEAERLKPKPEAKAPRAKLEVKRVGSTDLTFGNIPFVVDHRLLSGQVQPVLVSNEDFRRRLEAKVDEALGLDGIAASLVKRTRPVLDIESPRDPGDEDDGGNGQQVPEPRLVNLKPWRQLANWLRKWKVPSIHVNALRGCGPAVDRHETRETALTGGGLTLTVVEENGGRVQTGPLLYAVEQLIAEHEPEPAAITKDSCCLCGGNGVHDCPGGEMPRTRSTKHPLRWLEGERVAPDRVDANPISLVDFHPHERLREHACMRCMDVPCRCG